MHRPPGATHYEPIAWDDAFARIGARRSPRWRRRDRAVFYTSGRTSNEAAFVYQLFVRALGTNNLPDCSNMCHESSGVGPRRAIGIGKGTVTLDDIHAAELILVVGQNPGTNHPRMLSALERAKRNGAPIVAINPLPEAGLLRVPQPAAASAACSAAAPRSPTCTCRSGSAPTWRCSSCSTSCLVHDDGRPRPGVRRRPLRRLRRAARPPRRGSIPTSCWRPPASTAARSTSCTAGSPAGSGSSSAGRWGSPSTARRSPPSRRSSTSCCCAAASASRAPVPARCAATATCRATARWASTRSHRQGSSIALEAAFGFAPPRAARLRHGRRDRRDGPRRGRRVRRPRRQLRGRGARHRRDRGGAGALRAHRAGLDQAQPLAPAAAPRRSSCRASGAPSATRPARREQFVTVEDSMGMVHASRGAQPARRRRSCAARSRSCARSRRPRSATDAVDWGGLAADYDRIRDHIAAVVPGFDDFNERVRATGRVRPAQRPARRPGRSPPPRAGRGSPSTASTRSTCRRAACCCRRSARTTSTTPRSTGSTTATAASSRVAGWCS